MQRKDVEQMPGWWLVIGPDGEPDGAHCSVKPADEPYARKYISADAVETALRALLDRAERAEAERDAMASRLRTCCRICGGSGYSGGSGGTGNAKTVLYPCYYCALPLKDRPE